MIKDFRTRISFSNYNHISDRVSTRESNNDSESDAIQQLGSNNIARRKIDFLSGNKIPLVKTNIPNPITPNVNAQKSYKNIQQGRYPQTQSFHPKSSSMHNEEIRPFYEVEKECMDYNTMNYMGNMNNMNMNTNMNNNNMSQMPSMNNMNNMNSMNNMGTYNNLQCQINSSTIPNNLNSNNMNCSINNNIGMNNNLNNNLNNNMNNNMGNNLNNNLNNLNNNMNTNLNSNYSTTLQSSNMSSLNTIANNLNNINNLLSGNMNTLTTNMNNLNINNMSNMHNKSSYNPLLNNNNQQQFPLDEKLFSQNTYQPKEEQVSNKKKHNKNKKIDYPDKNKEIIIKNVGFSITLGYFGYRSKNNIDDKKYS